MRLFRRSPGGRSATAGGAASTEVAAGPGVTGGVGTAEVGVEVEELPWRFAARFALACLTFSR